MDLYAAAFAGGAQALAQAGKLLFSHGSIHIAIKTLSFQMSHLACACLCVRAIRNALQLSTQRAQELLHPSIPGRVLELSQSALLTSGNQVRGVISNCCGRLLGAMRPQGSKPAEELLLIVSAKLAFACFAGGRPAPLRRLSRLQETLASRGYNL